MRVGIVSGSNGIGLARDMRLVAESLEQAGIEVVCHAMGAESCANGSGRGSGASETCRRARCAGHPPFDVNLMIQHVRPEFLPQARVNVLPPNLEHFSDRDRRYLGALSTASSPRRAMPKPFFAIWDATRRSPASPAPTACFRRRARTCMPSTPVHRKRKAMAITSARR